MLRICNTSFLPVATHTREGIETYIISYPMPYLYTQLQLTPARVLKHANKVGAYTAAFTVATYTREGIETNSSSHNAFCILHKLQLTPARVLKRTCNVTEATADKLQLTPARVLKRTAV